MARIKEQGGGEEETILPRPLPPLSFFGCRLYGWVRIRKLRLGHTHLRHFTRHGEEKNTSNVLLLNTVFKRSSLTTDRK